MGQGLSRHFDHFRIECLHGVADSLDVRLENLLRQVGSGVAETDVFMDELDRFDEVLCQSQFEFLVSLVTKCATEPYDSGFADLYVAAASETDMFMTCSA